MTINPSIRTIIIIWLAWVAIMVGFQALVASRVQPERPDDVLLWTARETTANAQDNKPYLIDPFMNEHVSWDSEYYISIATAGYSDETVAVVGPQGRQVALNYAFMPFYPLVMALVAWPLQILGLSSVGTTTLAGILVSVSGTLAGMIGLYYLAREELGESGAIRTASYLIMFPTGFFLAQVYTEGLYVGLAFSCLALIRHKHLMWAALISILATWTKAAGATLVIPLALPWFRSGEWLDLDLEWRQIYYQGIPWGAIKKGLVSLAPVVAFLIWRFSYWGFAFNIVEENFFGRGLLSLGVSFFTWSQGAIDLFGPNSQRAVYYLIEFAAVILGFSACFFTFRRYPDLSIYSFVVIFLSLTSGPAQGMSRYILAAPSVFLFLGRLGQNEAFDRAWSIISILLMGLLATLFTFDMWVG